MSINSTIASLKAAVKAAQEEFELAVVFHEVWKPTAHDKELHQRMGRSYATHVFRIVRASLRREMLLALMRLWDKSPKAIRIEHIVRTLQDPDILKALAGERANKFRDVNVKHQMQKELEEKVEQASKLIGKYTKGGSHHDILQKLLIFRHEHFAHRQVERSVDLTQAKIDREIEAFYSDNSSIVRLLLTVVRATAYDPQETADMIKFYAGNFWAGVCGENTEGHPRYRQGKT